MIDAEARAFTPAMLAAIAREAALAVAPALRAAFRGQMTVEHKADLHDPVTEHDRRTERRLRAFLTERVPGSVVVGEEDGISGPATEDAGGGRIAWYVDPIDGTSNFAAGMAFWCISIGAVRDGEVVAGVVLDPMSGDLFWADDQGAWRGETPLRARSVAEEARALLITGYPVARDFRLDGQGPALAHFARLTEAFATLRRPGSAALSLCHVAAGWADAAAGFGVNPWDVTAAIAILRGAGGSYRPLRLGKAPPGAADQACPGYLATGPGVHYPTLEAVCDALETARARPRAGVPA